MLLALDSYDDSLGRESMSWMGVRSYLAFFSHPPHNPAKESPSFPMKKLQLREVTSVTQGRRAQTTIVTGGFSCLWLPVILPSAGLWADPGWLPQHHLGSLLKI